ncbi:MAG TPA: hypothetical protein PK954_23535, partial [Anaerolineales bacterium]|nr:hypothetical protein [Anaerolineales bacterium]
GLTLLDIDVAPGGQLAIAFARAGTAPIGYRASIVQLNGDGTLDIAFGVGGETAGMPLGTQLFSPHFLLERRADGGLILSNAHLILPVDATGVPEEAKLLAYVAQATCSPNPAYCTGGRAAYLPDGALLIP